MQPESFITSKEVTWVDPATLKPAPDNPRIPLKTADPQRYAELTASIQKGSFKPLLVEEGTNEIVDGHQSREVYIDLGQQCPILYIRKLTRKEKVRIRAAANAHAGAWDMPMLKAQLAELPKDDLPLLMLDAPTLDIVAPLPDAQPSPPDPDQKWTVVKFKLAKEAAERVERIIEKFCKDQRCKPGTALERIVEEWAQGNPDYYSDAA